MADFFCKYCGNKNSSVSGLTQGACSKNPEGKYHVPYEGSQKSQFDCKYCGSKNQSISGLTQGACSKNPHGKYHVPL